MVAATPSDRARRALSDPIAPYGVYALIVLAGVVAGFVNTVAGGGSLLTVPALMLLGMPVSIANGTNRLSVVTQAASGAIAFRRAGKLPTEHVGRIAAPTVIGAALGATIAALAPEQWLKPVLLGTMATMALVVLIKPDLASATEGEVVSRFRDKPSALAGLFFAGLYGGFAQAGVGIVMLAVLAGLMRFDIARANALKLVVVLAYGVVVLGIFVWAGQVDWIPAVVLAAATVVGSQLGVRFAIKAKPAWIRGLLFVTVIASCVAAYLKD